MSSGSVFSDTLNSITTAKLGELSKKRSTFERKYKALQETLKAEKDPLTRLLILSDGVKDCFNASTYTDKSPGKQKHGCRGKVIRGSTQNDQLETDLILLEKVLIQSRFDPGTVPHVIPEWEAKLMQYLETQSLKYRYATLYGELVTEWLAKEKKTGAAARDGDASDAFEELPGAKKLKSRIEWEKSVFEPLPMDVEALKSYLNELFGIDDEERNGVFSAAKALQSQIRGFETELARANPFTEWTLKWTIEGLLSSEVLDEDQRSVLKDFLGNQLILNEIADVLNLRFAALEDWSWGEFVPVEQRRRVTGAYRVHLHEDLLQAILLQYIGVRWAVFFRGAFVKFRGNKQAWKTLRAHIPVSFRKKLAHYSIIRGGAVRQTLNWKRRAVHRKGYFSAALPKSVDQGVENTDGDEEADLDDSNVVAAALAPPPPAPIGAAASMTRSAALFGGVRSGGGGIAARKSAPLSIRSELEGFLAQEIDVDSDADGEDDSGPRRPMKRKQELLHLVSTEVAINTTIHGEITCFRSLFDQWDARLPHATILTVLKWLGMSDRWLGFFRKFLEAPLKFADDEDAEIRIRRRGTPSDHSISEMFGETLRFCLDFSINQTTDGGQLHRIADDFWFWSANQDRCISAWKAIEEFIGVTGTSLNKNKTGCVRIGPRKPGDTHEPLPRSPRLPTGDIRWGFLKLTAATGRFEIDQALVDEQIAELQRQLADKSSSSVFAWVQAWNTYASTFFTSNFGRPARCFGQAHIQSILETHQRVHAALFGNARGSVADHVKRVLEERFGVPAAEIPDAFVFFPVELGGLGLRSPFVETVQLMDQLDKTVADEFAAFREAEREAYDKARREWEGANRPAEKGEGSDDSVEDSEEGEQFLSFEDYIRYREDLDYGFAGQLSSLFDRLLQSPEPETVDYEASIGLALERLGDTSNLKGITGNWYGMESYWRWVTAMYGPELVRRFDGLRIVDPSLLPLGMVSMLRGKRINWG